MMTITYTLVPVSNAKPGMSTINVNTTRRTVAVAATVTSSLSDLDETPQVQKLTTQGSTDSSKQSEPLSRGSSTTDDPLAAAFRIPVTVASSPKSIPQSTSNAKSTTAPGSSKSPITMTSPTSTSASTTTSTNPTALPVAGSKKSKRAIAGIALGVITAAIIALTLTYLIISRKRRSHNSPSHRAARFAGKHSRSKNGVNVIIVNDDLVTPMTPGGAKLEAQRGRMLSDSRDKEKLTGFRAIGQTPWNNVRGDGSGVPNLKMPVPAARFPDHTLAQPDLHVGVGVDGDVHPAYRHGHETRSGQVSGTKSELDLPGLTRQNAQRDTSGSRLSDESHKEGLAHSAPPSSPSSRSAKTTSWAPGNDVIDVLRPGPLMKHSNGNGAGSGAEKPRFNETTSKWSVVTSPTQHSDGGNSVLSWGIGKAVSTWMAATTSTTGQGWEQHTAKEKDGGGLALSTENEITSPVDGSVVRPKRRYTFRGFEEIVGSDGKLKRDAKRQ